MLASFVSKECREECCLANSDLAKQRNVKAKGSRYYLTSAGMTCETQVWTPLLQALLLLRRRGALLKVVDEEKC